MTKLEELHQQAMASVCNDMDAKLQRDGLQIIETMSRRGLLVAMDRDCSKENTERLRKTAKKVFLSGSPHFDLWAGYHA